MSDREQILHRLGVQQCSCCCDYTSTGHIRQLEVAYCDKDRWNRFCRDETRQLAWSDFFASGRILAARIVCSYCMSRFLDGCSSASYRVPR